MGAARDSTGIWRKVSESKRHFTLCWISSISDILLQMWAMKYSEAEPEKARSAYREIFGNQGGSKLKLWCFLSYEFHSVDSDNNPDRRALLEKAELHLENYKRENPCKFLSRIVTVKLLLGHPTEEVEAVFPRPDELEANELRAAMLATYGRFCEINNKHQEAIQKYQQVLTFYTGENSNLWCFRMAGQGIRRIEGQSNKE
ncbi:hypothetical protein EB796_022942 [Bugula neritina]|uniref:Uncharacterized protein n=1 Tax=Bugula neritina TaxID=10212 RepID=A0A7J7IXU4_BUGNE|nr:hypothetical protein EB796_022942 [Bugula neritina]